MRSWVVKVISSTSRQIQVCEVCRLLVENKGPEGVRFPALQSTQVTMCQHIPARMQRSASPLTLTSSAWA